MATTTIKGTQVKPGDIIEIDWVHDAYDPMYCTTENQVKTWMWQFEGTLIRDGKRYLYGTFMMDGQLKGYREFRIDFIDAIRVIK